MKEKFLIYYDWHLDIRAGGPPGYLANLRYGLDRADNPKDFELELWTAKKQSKNTKKESFYAKIAQNNSWFRYLRANYFSKSAKKYYKEYLHHVENVDNIFIQNEVLKKIKNENIKFIHTHYVIDALKVINTLKKERLDDVKVLLTSHMPEAPHLENYNLMAEAGYSAKKCRRFEKAWEHIEKRAFNESDILIFPSREAMEPYFDTLPEFKQWITNKDIRFVPTGAKQLETELTKEQAREKFGVKEKFVISYLGRHIKVKGYDVLKEAGLEILKQRGDAVFLIGGHESSEVKAPAHSRWKESGWVNPAEVLKASDVFILPNKRTYFDLILLEVLSTGTPVIASNTGGNKSVREQTGVLSLYDTTKEDLVQKINEFLDLPQAEKGVLERKSLKAYEEFYNPQAFAKNYLSLAGQIIKDYKGGFYDFNNTADL
ncbi:MAG: glycosyltransferase family 4 protein [Heliobacteriaceae bacterium]|jgi:glycosyltransferase involved in cell wall biosynthesis|nr:glycosyltransferase family 4 protein [Heliobacteriaceae bacterium]